MSGKLPEELSKRASVAARKANQAEKANPVWSGPESKLDNGGITFSLLSRFLSCRERFRLLVVKGLKAKEGMNHRLEYGNMWHGCCEAVASKIPWQDWLDGYEKTLHHKYPFQRNQVSEWAEVCRIQFPIYLEWWKARDKAAREVTLFAERVFHVPYTLPSGRVVYLRGKWDRVFNFPQGGVWHTGVMERKTKGDIDFPQLQRQLTFDLQTMLYNVALDTEVRNKGPVYLDVIKGGQKLMSPTLTMYDVVRRPLSGGKGNIRPHKEKVLKTKTVPAETPEEYGARLSDLITTAVGPEWDMPEGQHYFFQRMSVPITPRDLEVFKRTCLDPILEQLCDWWSWVKGGVDPFGPDIEDGLIAGENRIHYRHPYGVWNPLDEGRVGDLDHFLDSGNTTGLEKTKQLFPELQSGN